jgi:hypothetical protein
MDKFTPWRQKMASKAKAPRLGSKRKAKQPGSSERSGYRQKIREKKQVEASKPKGCAPLALFIPILAVGVYLFLMA